jgi:peptidoglycan/xylan/chitin deacetylase (PgdA/CDA1 family)
MGRLAARADRVFRGRGRGLILLYHRVADEPSDPYGLCVTPTHFAEHLEVMRGMGNPLSVAALAEGLAGGSLPDRAIGVTFDDAYLDVLEAGVPLLERHDVPATVFVTAGSAGRTREFWWDELERLFLQPGRLPESLEIDIAGRRRRWELDADAVYEPSQRRSLERWHLLDESLPSRRHAAFRELYHLLRPLPETERVQALDELLAWAGDGALGMRPSHRVMRHDEVAAMTAGGLVEAGAHTLTHPDLTAQPAAVRREEIQRSKRELEGWIGRPVKGFAYPYGHYDDASVAEVRDAGFDFACAGDHQVVRPDSPSLLLPRVDVPRGGGEVLGKLIRWYLG